jgi:beta-ribofuranosylaminobenzene 5'-phosphate synthase
VERPGRDDTGAGVDPFAESVRVDAPGRLHLGFLDPSATLGRRFGSVGITIADFSTVVEISFATVDAFVADEPATASELDRLKRHLAAMRAATGIDRPLHLALRRALPPHAGFGSGTQLALAVGRAFSALHRLSLSTERIARLLTRGVRSGIGVAAFANGGFLVDGGHAATTAPSIASESLDSAAGGLPPLLSRFDFPDAWRVVIVMDDRLHGLHGGHESATIAALPRFPEASAAGLCHRLLMCVLPAVVERDFAAFSAGILHIQDANGRYFAPAQGGSMYVSSGVARALGWIREHFPAAVGQSSWGPTGFAFVPSQAIADELIDGLRRGGRIDPEVRVRCVPARNHGALVSRHAGDRVTPLGADETPL